jgi:hypothetical protein
MLARSFARGLRATNAWWRRLFLAALTLAGVASTSALMPATTQAGILPGDGSTCAGQGSAPVVLYTGQMSGGQFMDRNYCHDVRLVSTNGKTALSLHGDGNLVCLASTLALNCGRRADGRTRGGS